VNGQLADTPTKLTDYQLGMCSFRKCPTIIYCLKNNVIPVHCSIS